MSKGLRFSLIVPIYGVEKYIVQCAESLFKQTYGDIQFVFVNDGTKDNSIVKLKELIKSGYQHLEGNIMIVDKENEGLPKARETGLSYADGDYILHLDSDDYIEETAVEQIAKVASETSADMIYFDFYKEYDSYSKLDKEKNYTADTKVDFIRNLFNYKAYGYVWNKCVKASVYKKHKVYFPLYPMHEDIYLMSQLICYSESIVHLNSALYHYRRNNLNSITRKKKKSRRQDSLLNMLDLYVRFMDDISGSPVEPMLGDIFYAAGWNSFLFDLDLFKKFPFLKDRIAELPISFRFRPIVTTQIFVKLYSRFVKC